MCELTVPTTFKPEPSESDEQRHPGDDERKDSAAALKAATGMMRSEVGKNITARLTPSIEFIADGIPENAALIDDLLREARERDTQVGEMARAAVYAGDEDPYVKPREYAEDDDADEDDIDADEAGAAPASTGRHVADTEPDARQA